MASTSIQLNFIRRLSQGPLLKHRLHGPLIVQIYFHTRLIEALSRSFIHTGKRGLSKEEIDGKGINTTGGRQIS